MSAGSMAYSFLLDPSPRTMPTFTARLQGTSQPLSVCLAPPTDSQKRATSRVGPRISVVPVSRTAIGAEALLTVVFERAKDVPLMVND